MASFKAGQQAEQMFRNTVNRGSYKNKPQVRPRGGFSTK